MCMETKLKPVLKIHLLLVFAAEDCYALPSAYTKPAIPITMGEWPIVKCTSGYLYGPEGRRRALCDIEQTIHEVVHETINGRWRQTVVSHIAAGD